MPSWCSRHYDCCIVNNVCNNFLPQCWSIARCNCHRNGPAGYQPTTECTKITPFTAETVMKGRANQWKAVCNEVSPPMRRCLHACAQLHGHSATLRSRLKQLQKNKTRNLFDIEIRTLKAAEKAPLCRCVRWSGEKPFHCLEKKNKKQAPNNERCVAWNLIFKC